MDEKLTAEQLREEFQKIYKSIQSGIYENGNFMSPKVLRRRLAFIVLGEYVPQYDALSEEEKQNFGFDVDGLVEKVKELLRCEKNGRRN